MRVSGEMDKEEDLLVDELVIYWTEKWRCGAEQGWVRRGGGDKDQERAVIASV